MKAFTSSEEDFELSEEPHDVTEEGKEKVSLRRSTRGTKSIYSLKAQSFEVDRSQQESI